MNRRGFFGFVGGILAAAVGIGPAPHQKFRRRTVYFIGGDFSPPLEGISWGSFKLVTIKGEWMNEVLKNGQAAM